MRSLALEVEGLSFAYEGGPQIIQGFGIHIEAGEKVAIVGENGVGKTTLLRLLAGELQGKGKLKWAEKARLGYYAQDHSAEFASDTNLVDWIGRCVRSGGYEGADIETLTRGTLGRLLFSGDEFAKPVKVLSGGEQGRMMFGRLMLERPNVLLMDEPTNHLDMESIESLNTALEKFSGTLVFVSHDREFVSTLATRVLEVRPDGIVDHRGSYDDYLARQGLE